MSNRVKKIRSFEGQFNRMFFVAFSPDGKQIVLAFDGNTISLCDIETGEVIREFKGHVSYVNSTVFSPDGKQIVSASEDKTVRIWNVETGEEIHRFEGHKHEVMSAMFSPNGKLIVSTDQYCTECVWNVESGAVFQKLELPYTAVSFSPDGRQLVSSSCEDVLIWDFEPLQELMDRVRERFKDRPLTPAEKKKYYLD